MLIVEDEATTFEVNPLGNRQRLKPRDSFIARNARQTRPILVPSMVQEIDESMLMQETVDESLSEGMYTMSDVVLPANAVVHAALDHVPAMPSLLPQPAALMLLPKEIDYHVTSSYYPPTDSHTALPIASRRVRYIAVPVLAMLALVVLGGAAMPPEVEAIEAPAAHVVSTQEATSAPRVREAANEPPAPIEQIVEAPVVKKKHVTRAAPRSRKVVVNASTALGNLRPGRF